MNMDSHFLPAVKCPHCGKVNHPEISGWGGELSTRYKVCRSCELEYVLLVYTTADVDVDNTPTRINSIKDRIRFLKQRIKEKRENIENQYASWAEEFIRTEALTGGKQN